MTVTVTSLATATSTAEINFVNNEGVAVGYSLNGGAVEWQNGTVTTLSGLVFADAVNDQGVVVGGIYSYFGSTSAAIVWQNGAATKLATLGGTVTLDSEVANGINDAGQIVGSSAAPGGLVEASLWQNGTVTSLGTLPGGTGAGTAADYNSTAAAINASGQIVGSSWTSSGFYHAFLWQNGVMTDLGTFVPGDHSFASDINNKGQVVGYDEPASYESKAFLWQNGVMTDLGTLPGDNYSEAQSINDSGIAVGQAGIYANPSGNHAVMWQDGKIIDLNNLLSPTSGWFLQTATGINDNGEIVGNGSYNGVWGQYSLFLSGNAAVIGVTVPQALQSDVTTSVAVVDSAAAVTSSLNGLESLWQKGLLTSITLTDGGIPTLALSSAQLLSDQDALSVISGEVVLRITPSSGNVTIAGTAGDANVVLFSGAASQYQIAATGDGTSFTVTSGTVSDTISGVTALQFSDHEVFVAHQAGAGASGVSSVQVVDLYAAVLAREPDAGGLAYYETMAQQNPQIGITTYAEDFLQSPEYTAAHNYAQTSAGDAQFITDTYANLLHRAPEAGAVAWYQANVITPLLSGAAPGTAAYASAELAAHAAVLADFSQSAEFLGDVSVTAQHPADTQHWLVLI